LQGPPKFAQIGSFGLKIDHLATLTKAEPIIFDGIPRETINAKEPKKINHKRRT
jgi:hypothetical protein